MIKFDDVSKQFPLGNVALKNVSFEIKENEFVFFVGPSGAGKTTILKLILRQLIPSSGTLLVDDYDLSNDAFQDFKIMLDKNVFENIALSLKVLGASHQQIAEEIKEALNLVGLSSKTTVFPAQLSAGELQRVAIARAIVGDREIIIADEPTGNLDPKTAWDIMKIFKKLEGEKTILFATHNSDIVNSLRKRVIIMKDGKLVKDVKKGGYEE